MTLDLPAMGKTAEYPRISADIPVSDIYPRLLESPERVLDVCDGESHLGWIDRDALLDGMSRVMVPRADTSQITLECHAGDYSASRLAMAAEDANVNVTDIWTAPMTDGKLSVTLRLHCDDPSGVIRSVERYGYEVKEVTAPDCYDLERRRERLSELQLYLDL